MFLQNTGRLMAAVLMAATVAACASVPMAPSDADSQAKQFQPPPAGQATLYVFREGIFFGDGVLLSALAGPRMLGQLGPGHYFRVNVQPGEYDMRCSGGENAAATMVKVAPGETRFVEVAARLGFGTARCAIFEVGEQQARSAIAHGKRAAEIR